MSFRITSTNTRIWLGLLLLATAARAASLPDDAEAAAHGDDAANVQRVKETEQASADFVFRQYNLAVLSHYSYLIGSGGEAMIVDPARDISRYLKDAQELGVKITRVYLTHSHADFVAGHMELAHATGATIIANAATQAGYAHKAVVDGDAIAFGKVRAVVVTTPGHTPDGTCLYVHHPASETNPAFVLTASKSTSPTRRYPRFLVGSSARFTPISITTTPGLTMFAVMVFGRPTAAITISASRVNLNYLSSLP